MKKSIMIGLSTFAVILLVLGSLTNVVGFQSLTSNSLNDSPLFSIRTNKATNNGNKRVITSDYLGKGLNPIRFPPRDNRIESLKNVIEIISKMDDKTYAQLTALVLHRAKADKILSDINPKEITQILSQLRTKQETIIQILISESNDKLDPTSNCIYTIFNPNPRLLCLIITYILAIFLIIGAIIDFIFSMLTILC